jgi:PAS domain S-box-containing protein
MRSLARLFSRQAQRQRRPTKTPAPDGVDPGLSDREQWLNLILDAVPVLIAYVDADQRCRFSNKRYEDWFGHQRSDADGRPLRDRMGAAAYAAIRAHVDEVLSGREVTFEAAVPYKDGGTRQIRATYVPDVGADGVTRGFVALIVDITDQKQMETTREGLLRREQTARIEAEAANRAKDEFLAMLSHELRTPLTPMVGWIRMLQDGALDSRQASNALASIDRNSKLLMQLIDNLLDVSRIVAGTVVLDKRAVNLVAAVEGAVDTMRASAETKGLTLTVALDPSAGTIVADRLRLQQIVANLVSNAIKFTSRGGRIEVRLERGPSNARIVIQDTGPGIDPELLPHIFDRFRQADSTPTRRHGGLGLGLAIVRHLVDLHGGAVHAESAGPDRGSTFIVDLPIAVARPDEDSRSAGGRVVPATDRARLHGVRVLVVDDHEDSRQLIRIILEHHGAEVWEAGTVDEALAVLKQSTVDLLVSDIGLPGADGLDLIRELRAQELEHRGPPLPAIALTAYTSSEDRARILRGGFDAHAAKPVDPVEFLDVVARMARPTARP